jgi:protein-arginine kinase activator protein McsA
MLVDNYLDLTIEEVYDVISKINVWPHTFNKQKKIKLMNSMINYFIEKEEYEKCAVLQRFINELENSQQSDRRSRIEPN